MERDYYSTLGIGRFASQDEIRRAFHSRILLVHPDRNPTDAVAADRTRELIEAYKTLTNLAARYSYDTTMARPTPSAAASAAVESALKFWITKAIVAAVFLALSIVLVTGVTSVLAGRGRVFRPCPGVIDVLPDAPAPPAVISSPGLSDIQEWYAAKQYQMSLAGCSATCALVHTYSHAAGRALRAGNVGMARFYARSVREIEDASPHVTL